MTASAADIIQAVRGPLMLITLGALIAIDHLGIYRFGVTWPVLVIVFGLLKLLERMVRVPVAPPPYPPPGYGPPPPFTPPPPGGRTA